MTKKAVLYARVSTDDQAEKGYSLPSQLDLCRKYAGRMGFEIVQEFREEYSGATPIAERPEGKKVAAMLKARQADALIVYQVDRLSRDIVDLLASVRQWIRADVEVHTCDIGKIESELDIVLVIKGWQGSDERKKIIERTTRGRNHKAREEGKVVGGGRAVYGYQYIRDAHDKTINFEIYEPTARIVRLIFNWYVYGDENGKPMAQYLIARRLSEIGVPPPSAAINGRADWKKRPRLGMWGESTIHNFLGNETYTGVWRFGKKIGKNGKGGDRLLDEQIMVNVPAIIDHDLWEHAQARRAYNKKMSKRNVKGEYLLRGLVKCGCGHSISGYSKTGRSRRHFYYQCSQPSNRFPGLEKICREKLVHAEELEAFA